MPFELLFQVDDVEGKTQEVRHPAGVIGVVEGTAPPHFRAMLSGGISPGIPELHRATDDSKALFPEQESGRRTVDPSAEC